MIQSPTVSEATYLIAEAVKFIGYIAVIAGVAYRLGVKFTHIEASIKQTTDRLNEHITRVDRMFDRFLEEKFRKE